MTASHILIRPNTRNGLAALANRDEIFVVLDDGTRIDISHLVVGHHVSSQAGSVRRATIETVRFAIEPYEGEPVGAAPERARRSSFLPRVVPVHHQFPESTVDPPRPAHPRPPAREI